MSARGALKPPRFNIPQALSSSEDWRLFETDLAGAIADLAEDEYLIVSSKQGNRFVQFAAQGGFGLRAETVGNSYLPKEQRLSAADCRHLISLGWRSPTHGRKTENGHPIDGSPNFFIDAAAPVPFDKVAGLAVATLREVLRIGHPGFLEYKAFGSDGGSIRFPTLRIRRADPTSVPAPPDKVEPSLEAARAPLQATGRLPSAPTTVEKAVQSGRVPLFFMKMGEDLGRDRLLQNILAASRSITGRDATPEEIEEARKALAALDVEVETHSRAALKSRSED